MRIIVPYGAGGIADVTMRMTAKQLSEHFGQQFFIDNRPGAGGILAMKAVQETQPDGYTLFMIGGGLTIAKALFKSLPYNIETDFIPISTTASYGLVIATKAGSPLKTVKDIIAAAKANPGKLNFGTINAGSTQHLSAELFRIMAGINVATIPYKTTPDLALAVLRGDIDVAFEYFPGLQSAIAEGRITAVATTGAERAGQSAERADRDRERPARLRGDELERHRRAGRHAAGNRARAQPCRRRRAGLAVRCRNTRPQPAWRRAACRRPNSPSGSTPTSSNGRR